MIPVGPWTPDSPDFRSKGSLEALNVIASPTSYRPFPSFATFSSAMTARAQGGTFIRKTDGTGVVFAGDVSKLYKLAAVTFSDVSRVAGGPYTTPADGRWNFAQFGSSVIAINGLDAAQVFNVDSDSNFSALPGSPPIAKYQAVAGDFLAMAHLNTDPAKVQWSGINNIGQWAQSVTTQADSQSLPDGGWIQGICGYEYAATILQEFAIRRMTYVGPPGVFQFSKIADGMGATIDGSVASYQDKIFFVDRSGFYMIVGGVQVIPIGTEEVNRYFWSDIDPNNFARLTSAIDPVNSLYVVNYPDTNNSGGTPNKQLSFNWDNGGWSHQQPGNLEMVFSGATQTGFTLEQLDTISTNLDALPYSLDSQVYAGVARRLIAGFDTTHKLGFFNGPNLQATVTTTEDTIGDGNLTKVTSVRPMVDGGTPIVTLGTRDRLEDAVVFGNPSTIDAYGRCHFNTKARYHRAQIVVPAGQTWTHIQGIDNIVSRVGGKR